MRYFQKNYAMHAERMRGVAATVGRKLEDDGWNFAGLYYGFRLPGCNAIFYPPKTTIASYSMWGKTRSSSARAFTRCPLASS